MANSEQQVVKLMAQEIIKAIKKLNEENNKNYVDNQLKNIKATNVGGGVSIPSNVTASQVVGLYSAIASYIANSPENSLAGDQEAGKIVSTISGLAAIEIQSATIDTAQIENLYSSYGEFLNLVAKNAEIEGLDVEELRAAMSEIGLANIGSANIGWGQIKDLVTDTAIIREGVGGKLYIDRLAVTDAQILSLTTGELVIQGSDGKLYTVYVDANGDVVTALRTVSGDDIEENTITGTLIAEDAITARELNVSQIFADSALINAIKAANIDVNDLFANDAFINVLTANIIQSPNIGSDLDISGNSSITLAEQKIGMVVSSESSESELVLTDKMLDIITDKAQIAANNIDLSANESITLIVKNEVSKISDTIFVGEEPKLPDVDMVWLDTSVSPNLFKRWDGDNWVVINDTNELVEGLSTVESKIETNSESIGLISKDVSALSGRVQSAEQKITPEAITQVVRDSEAYKEDISSATMTSEKFETFVSGSQGISSISQKANEIDLLIESDSSSTEVKFTDAAIQAFTDEMKVNVTDQIELKVGELQEQVDSAETQIKANTDAIALKASEQDVGMLKERISEAEEKITAKAIVQTVRTSSEYTQDINEVSDRLDGAESAIEQNAQQIELRVKQSEYDTLDDKVSGMQSEIIQHAEDITLVVGKIDDVNKDIQILDDKAIYEGSTPPPAPIPEGKLWLDRSIVPPVLKRWLGDADVPVDGVFTRMDVGNPVKTVGKVQRFDSIVTEFKPVQEGSGDPYPAGGGKNLLPFPYEDGGAGTVKTINGATFTINADSSITVNGTPTASAYIRLAVMDLGSETFVSSETVNATNGTYVLSKMVRYNGNSGVVSINLKVGDTYENVTYYPQVEIGTVATEWQPYENTRPITGWNALNLNHVSKNLLSLPYVHGGVGAVRRHNGITFTVNEDGSITADGTVEGDRAIYIVNRINLGNQSISPGSTNGTYALSEKLRYNAGAKNCSIELLVGTTWDNVTFYPQIELGAVATEFEPPQGELHTVQFSQTVYGGSYGSFTGKLISEWGIYTVTGNESWRWHETLQRWETGSINVGHTCTGGAKGCLDVVCSHSKTAKAANNPGVWVYSSSDSTIALRWKMENNPFSNVDEFKAWLAAQHIQFVYKLAVPIEIELDPQQITAFDGTNVFYGDGTISVTYTGTGWETVNDVNTLRNAQDILTAQQDALRRDVDELNSYTRLDNDGLWVGKQGDTGQTLLKYDSVNIVVNGKIVTTYAAKYQEMGGMRMFTPNAGGLAFAPSGN